MIDCVVALVPGPEGEGVLAAYIHGDADDATLREAVGRRLPAWMVPAAFVRLASIPRAPNGKRDRKRLPPPEWLARCDDPSFPADDPAGGPVGNANEGLLLRLFSELTGSRRVALDDSLFDLGGHSLVALRLLARLRKETG